MELKIAAEALAWRALNGLHSGYIPTTALR